MTAKDFLDGLPVKVNKDAIEGINTVFHFDLQGEGGTQMTLAIEDGEFSAKEGLHGEAKCAVTANAEDFMKLVSGELNPMMAILTGKIQITNQGEMLKYAKMFGLM